MTERQRPADTVDIACAQCAKPMMMLSFNYTSLTRGFESITLRYQYCDAEETRPWTQPERESDESSDQQSRTSEPHNSFDSNTRSEIDARTTEFDSECQPQEQPSTLGPNSSAYVHLSPDNKPAP